MMHKSSSLSAKRYRLSDSLMYWLFTFCGISAVASVLGIAGYLFDHRNPAAACGELRRRLL